MNYHNINNRRLHSPGPGSPLRQASNVDRQNHSNATNTARGYQSFERKAPPPPLEMQNPLPADEFSPNSLEIIALDPKTEMPFKDIKFKQFSMREATAELKAEYAAQQDEIRDLNAKYAGREDVIRDLTEAYKHTSQVEIANLKEFKTTSIIICAYAAVPFLIYQIVSIGTSSPDIQEFCFTGLITIGEMAVKYSLHEIFADRHNVL
eukprot:CAMPEP_0178544870 /NCGR_PEP_ID=MMETSP0697-20121206/3343_1 /TAXON_ID=265572 /ORGANISM="Extubocellulus spinifer, Strain CCMP396" /LENGTH=206 /DNA_ID=CAMNT_0020177407 /DNA_START=493 /DNA_END=1112 /DNA_ORIENTATION=-